jgi:hypothetical protein
LARCFCREAAGHPCSQQILFLKKCRRFTVVNVLSGI